MHDLHLYIPKMLANREMVNFQKGDFFRFFVILLLKIVSLQEHETCILSIGFALFVANNAYKSFCCAKSVAFLFCIQENYS